MKKYIMSITYNFDADYIAKAFDTEHEAVMEMNRMLDEEVEIIKRESEYEPSVIRWNFDDILLVYEEGYTLDNIQRGNIKDFSYLMEDNATYRVFEIEM